MCNSHSPEITQLLNFIKQKYHIDFSGYAPPSFERRIQKIIAQEQLTGPLDLITKLHLNPNYLTHLISEITVNVTSLFRDPSSWLALRNLLKTSSYKKRNTIKIWIAGCSTGEELFSLNIILHELDLLHCAEIIATDINSKAILVAKNGVILKAEFHLLEKAYREAGGTNKLATYFKERNNELVFSTDLTSKNTIRQHNLITSAPFNKVDLIICRNVLIYFSQQQQNQVVKRFNESSIEQAYLFLGKNESLDCLPSASLYELINSKEKIYRKRSV